MAFVKEFQNLLFPKKCIACGTWISNRSALCPKCREKFEKEKQIRCKYCNQVMASCICRPPVTGEAVLSYHALIPYDKHSVGGKLILFLKRNKDREVLCFLSKELGNCLRDHCILEENALITFVPRRKGAVLTEGVDQAKELASFLSKELGLEKAALLKRSHRTVNQKELTLEERRKNAENLYMLKRKKTVLENRQIVLVDDVLTSGATVKDCSEKIEAESGRPVIVLTVGRKS